MIAGIETGGTKIVCSAAESGRPEEPLLVRRFPTDRPHLALARVDAFLDQVRGTGGLDAVGIAAFGPVNVDRRLPRYGWITGTSKPGWADTDLLGGLPAARGVPTALLSDVSGAALAESRWGAGREARSIAYATFGTGVGVGVVADGFVVQGNGYPEVGHLLVRRHPEDGFAGVCPFHGDCAEGLVSGPAVLGRWGADSSSLPPADRAPAFDLLGYYVAQVAAAVGYAHGVERVVVGGGVLQAPGLLEAARDRVASVTGGPLAGHSITGDPAAFLVPAALGDRSGVLGALAAAQDLVDRAARPVLVAEAAAAG